MPRTTDEMAFITLEKLFITGRTSRFLPENFSFWGDKSFFWGDNLFL